jgi:hypothetical protein
VRRPAYFARLDWRRQFTIRYDRPSGAKTEWEKLREGWGDFFFYGFSDPTETRIRSFVLLDLRQFRTYCDYREIKNPSWLPGDIITNPDGTQFLACPVGRIPRGSLNRMVIARRNYKLPPIDRYRAAEPTGDAFVDAFALSCVENEWD